jgi:serine/threonine protein kinase
VELREGAVIADRFRLLRLLGKGGMGEVWAAQHASLDIPCAVKFIHADASSKPEVRARFEREAKAAAQLRTPNVVQILDYGVFDSTPYIAMEYLDGEPLNARLSRRQRLDPAETFHIVAGIGKALMKAHVAGIVHRDLKPENVFLVQDDDGETPKVLDFGVAKQADTLDSNTKTGALLGTPYYMSPEQAQGTKTVDHRADLWSLGVLTYRCLTCELPFKSTALGDLLIKIVTHPIPVPSHAAPWLPPGFDAWWARAAERDTSRRFQTASEMVEALGAALGIQRPPRASAQSHAGHSGISMQGGTVLAAPNFQPSGSFSQSGASQMVPPTMPGTAQFPPGSAVPPGSMGGAQHATPMPHQSGSYPQPFDHHGASMAGVTATAATPSGGSKRVAMVAVAVALVGLGGAGAFLAIGGLPSDAPPASPSEATPAAPPTDPVEENEAATGESPEIEKTADEASGDSSSAVADAPPSVERPRGSAPSRPTQSPPAQSPPTQSPPTQSPPTQSPPTTAPPTNLDVPEPRPAPKPKPDGFDPGF